MNKMNDAARREGGRERGLGRPPLDASLEKSPNVVTALGEAHDLTAAARGAADDQLVLGVHVGNGWFDPLPLLMYVLYVCGANARPPNLRDARQRSTLERSSSCKSVKGGDIL